MSRMSASAANPDLRTSPQDGSAMHSYMAISVVILSILFGLTIVDCGSGNSSQAASAPVTQPAPTPPPPAPGPPPGGVTFTVLHDFNCNEQDGAGPGAGLSTDQAGNLYGATEGGGTNGLGTVFKLTNMGSGWDYAVLYNFQGSPNGATPEASVSVALDGSLYGTTAGGGNTNCLPYCGTVFNLTPPLWTETSIFHFSPSGGTWPRSDLVFDQTGNIYGTTLSGGNVCFVRGCGVVYELTPSNAGWTETVLHKFTPTFNGNSDGVGPVGGTIFELKPSSGTWTFTILYSLPRQGNGPMGRLAIDPAGNLYGMSYGNGAYGAGAAFKLTSSGATWIYTSVHDFTGGSDGKSPIGHLTLRTNGKLYGTTYSGGACGAGVVFEISPLE